MWKNRLIYLSLVIGTAAIFIASNHRLALLLLICFLAAAVCSFLLLLLQKANNQILLSAPKSNGVQHPFYLNISVVQKWKIPTGRTQLTLRVDNALYEEAEKQNLLLHPSRQKQVTYKLDFEKQDCGRLRIALVCGRQEDLFGIWQIPLALPEQLSYLAYPVIPEMEILPSGSHFRDREGEQYSVSQSGNDVTEVHDLRDYRKGDPLNSIHWKLSEKLDRLIVREFGRPLNQQALLVYDGGFPGFQQAHEKVNAVLGMIAALSQAMIRIDRVHRICFAHDGELYTNQIQSISDMLDCLTELLECHLSEMSHTGLGIEHRQVSDQMIIVTGYFNEMRFAEIGSYTDLTVILLIDGDKGYYREQSGFHMLGIPVSHVASRIHQIEL